MSVLLIFQPKQCSLLPAFGLVPAWTDPGWGPLKDFYLDVCAKIACHAGDDLIGCRCPRFWRSLCICAAFGNAGYTRGQNGKHHQCNWQGFPLDISLFLHFNFVYTGPQQIFLSQGSSHQEINPQQRCRYCDSPFARKDTFLYSRVQKWISGNGTSVYPKTETP